MSFQNSASIKFDGVSRLQVKETVAMLILSVLLPFLVHFLPAVNSVPAGAYLIPVFFVALTASVLFKLHVGLVLALLTPAVNYWLTGSPRPEAVTVLTLELAAFVMMVSALKNVKYIKYGAAVIAFMAAKVISFAVISSFLPAVHVNILASAAIAIPGIFIMQALNVMLVRYRK